MRFYKNNFIFHRIHRRLISRKIDKKKAYILQENEKAALQYGINKAEKRSEQIIVSLTSFPKRFSTIHICLKSLLLQETKPDRIIVWFGDDVQADMITEEMHFLKQYGVEYRFVPGNLKPHKKYFYAMQEFPDAVIITVDDDVVYPKDTITNLIDAHNQYPDAVCARRLHKIVKDSNGKLLPYTKWMHDCRNVKKPSMNLFATGVGGVLYPSKSLHKDAFDSDMIEEYCLGADDVWLKCMEMLQNTPVVWAKCLVTEPPVIAKAQEVSLNKSNVVAGENDKYIENTFSLYPQLLKMLD